MKKFKDYIDEASKPVSTGVISHEELLKHIGKGKMKAITAHKYHQIYASHYAHPTGYKYEKDHNGFEHVYAGHGQAHNGVKHMVRFDLSTGRSKVNNAHVFKNKDDQRHSNGQLFWSHTHSHKEDE